MAIKGRYLFLVYAGGGLTAGGKDVSYGMLHHGAMNGH